MGYHDGMQTRVWGPMAWGFLHSVAHNYDPSKSKAYDSFFRSLAGVLPCKTCRENYQKLITGQRGDSYALKPSVFRSRDSFSYWLYRLHCRVSKDLYETCHARGEPCVKPLPETRASFQTIKARYESYRASSCKANEGGCRTPMRGKKKKTVVRVEAIG